MGVVAVKTLQKQNMPTFPALKKGILPASVSIVAFLVFTLTEPY